MADPIQAIELHAKECGEYGCYPGVNEGPEGLSATRHFRIYVPVETNANLLSAINLPDMWTPHPDLPATSGLNIPVVQKREFVKLGGDHWLAHIYYEPVTPGTSNPDDTAEDGDAFTEPRESTDQATIRQDVINGDPLPETSVEASKLELIVTCYKESVTGALAAWVNLANKVNTNAVTFPAFRGSTEQVTVAADQLLARSMSIEPARNGLQKLTLTFGYGPVKAWKLRWVEEDDEGTPVLGHENDIYQRANFNTGAFWT